METNIYGAGMDICITLTHSNQKKCIFNYMMPYNKRSRMRATKRFLKECRVRYKYILSKIINEIEQKFYSTYIILEKDKVSYYKNFKLHRTDGPALINYHTDSGQTHTERYYINNKLHRTDGPAMIWRDGTGNIRQQSYYKNDILHREDGPAVIEHLSNGQLYREDYVINGKYYCNKDHPSTTTYDIIDGKKNLEYYKIDTKYREDGPGEICYHKNGKPSKISYMKNNLYHRNGKPAITEYFYNGAIRSEYYYINNRQHRSRGPAYIYYNKSGEIIDYEYIKHGIITGSKNKK